MIDVSRFDWRPVIGDPSTLGWFTTTAYALAVVVSLAAMRRAGSAPGLPFGSRLMWLFVTGLVLFLGLNKQLDLQSILNEVGRTLSFELGLYEHRRELQRWFILILLAVSSLGAVSTFILFRGFWKQHLLLISGLVLILSYIALRAASIEHVVPQKLARHLENPRVGGVMELGRDRTDYSSCMHRLA